LKGLNHVLVNADDVNFMRKNINTTKKNAKILQASQEVALEVNVDIP